jgi:hypothetical protein
MSNPENASDILQQCVTARQEGADFPTIWNTILKRHPLVSGPPVQAMHEGQARLEIMLITGQRLIFDRAMFSLL